jgi:hypothetical protein
MLKGERTGPYEVGNFEFWVQKCTIWYDSDGNGTVDTNVTWEDFKADGSIDQATKNGVEAQLDALGCKTP